MAKYRKRPSCVVSVSLPKEILALADELAKEEGRTRSELVREALREYAATRRWRELRRWGGAASRGAGLEGPEAIEDVIDEVRRQR